jgi:DNA-binding NtrC family response regulator
MRRLFGVLESLENSDAPVLIEGETGTGKELTAQALHAHGTRSGGPLVIIDCSSIPKQLMESELFGHCKGAFTGADEDKPGLLELASGGTLFLDEVGDMPLSLQAKLLRVLQEKSARRVGGHEQVPLDLRLIAATHKDLRAMVASGDFREDLYYRLAAAELRVPPLRERERDVPLLAEEFLGRLNREHRRSVVLTDAGRTQLQRYTWPGNVRELEHVMERAVLMARDARIRADDLGLHNRGDTSARLESMTLEDAERYLIQKALTRSDGNVSRAAVALGLSRSALYRRLQQYGLNE